MRKILLKMSRIIAKHAWLYCLLNCTWGLPMTLIGALTTLVLLPFRRPKRFAYAWRFEFGKTWGGVSLGMTFITDCLSITQLHCHEYGHTFQNAILGPFMPFVVAIPSMIRYWYRYLRYERKGLMPTTDYDAIWFEASATEIGIEAYSIYNLH